MKKQKLFIIFHYILLLMLLLFWFIIMFLPTYMSTTEFKIFFSIYIIFSMVYSLYRKKYFFQYQNTNIEKVFAIFLILSLFIRLIFF